MNKYYIILFFSVLIITSAVAENNSAKKEFDCVVIPSKTADLGSNIRGVLKDIKVDRNSVIKKGDIVAVLDNTLEKAVLNLVQKQASINSEINLRKVNLAYAKREETRAKKAYRNKAFSMHELDMAKVETQLSKIKLLQAKEKQKLIKGELEKAKAKLHYKTIRAPFDGVVMEKFRTIGEYIDDEAIVRLAKLDPLYVEMIVPVNQHHNIKAGMQARVCADQNGNNGWIAKVTQVDTVMHLASGTFNVRLELPNPDYAITAGVRCNLEFLAQPLNKE